MDGLSEYLFKWRNFDNFLFDEFKNSYIYFSTIEEMRKINDPKDCYFENEDFFSEIPRLFFCSSLTWNIPFKNERDICVEYRLREILEELLKQGENALLGNINYKKDYDRNIFNQSFKEQIGKTKITNLINRMINKEIKNYFIKDSSYKNEKEIRIIISTRLGQKIKINISKCVKAVYINEKLFLNKTDKFRSFLRILNYHNIKFYKIKF